jgi:hypothetical protein
MCPLKEETLHHVMIFSSPDIATKSDTLIRSRPIHAPTVGSHCTLDILLTVALQEQHHALSWFQLALRHIGSKWSVAASSFDNFKHQPLGSHLSNTSTALIKGMWEYKNTPTS